MEKRRTVMVVGLGVLGARVIEYLASDPKFSKEHGRILGCDINEDKGLRVVNNARAVAFNRGLYPKLNFFKLNMDDVDSIVETLRSYEPDLVFQNTSLLTWWLPKLLPPEIARDMDEAGIGPFVPCHLALLQNLMRGIRRAGLNQCKVVNASIPDITGPMLAKKDLSFEVGIGNLANYVPNLKFLVSKKLGVEPGDVTIYWYAHHGVIATIGATGTTGEGPYYLKVLVKDRDVTERFDPGMKTMQTQNIGWPPMPAEFELYNDLIATSAYRVLLGIWGDTGEMLYAPSPRGLPGGWTVRVDGSRVEPVLPDGVSLHTLVKINEEGGRIRDGVEEITNDGSLVLTEKSRNLIMKHLGLDYKKFMIDDCPRLASDIVASFQTLAEKTGAKIPR